MNIVTYSVKELAATIGYRSSRHCALNMERAANYARDKYPFLQFQIKSGYIYRDYVREWVCVDGTMCRKSRWLTAIFCTKNSSKMASIHKFLTQEFISVPIEDLVDFMMRQEDCDAQILQVLLGLRKRAEFTNLVEATLSVHQIKLQKTFWEYHRQPKSYNYNLPLPVVKSLVHYVRASEDFANNPMREFVNRLADYFIDLDVQSEILCQQVEENIDSERICQQAEEDIDIALESVPDLIIIDTESKTRQWLNLTVLLLLFLVLLACVT